MKKRILSMGLAAVMAGTLVSGYANTNMSTVQAKDKVEVEFWYSGGKTAVNVLSDMVKEFNKSQDTYVIKTKTQADYDETYEKMQAAIAGKKAPDLALMDVSQCNSLNEKGVLQNINKYINKDKDFDAQDYLSTFYDQGVKGKTRYAFPAYGTTQVLYYNKEAFEKNGIDSSSIQTWQDLASAAKTMTSEDGSFVGWEPMWGPNNLIDAVYSNGGSILSKDGKKVLINDKKWVEVWESFRQWIHDDKIMKVHSGGQGWEYWYKTIDDVLQNKAGGYTGSSGDQADLDFSKVGAIEQPGFNGNASKPSAGALQFCMLKSSDTEKQKGAYEFMKFFTSPENQAKWSMETGYVAVRNSTQDVPSFQEYTQENPQALVPFQQAQHGTADFLDPTGGKITDAIKQAADQVELENVSAKKALNQAAKTAQAALDEVNAK